jgi:hypothetical protein
MKDIFGDYQFTCDPKMTCRKPELGLANLYPVCTDCTTEHTTGEPVTDATLDTVFRILLWKASLVV